MRIHVPQELVHYSSDISISRIESFRGIYTAVALRLNATKIAIGTITVDQKDTVERLITELPDSCLMIPPEKIMAQCRSREWASCRSSTYA